MALTEKLPEQIDWKIWGGVAVAVIVVAGALGYWLDWFGTDASEPAAPAAEEAAPTSE
ncbi:hypothetical protein [Rhodosalinus sp.]|uniref:hypothetical protein n=1 Tax=Rhodosalinus sp. TaxID=2047741 RepID=UPI00397E8244